MVDYRGLFGAFPYAFRETDSRLCKSYILLSGVLAVLVTLAFLISLVGILASPGGGGSFVVLLALLVVAPLVAPVLFVAHQHRTAGGTGRYDVLLALSGYVFVGTLYAGALASAPDRFKTTDSLGVFEPVVRLLYAVPEQWGALIPVAGAVLIYATHRFAR